MSKEDNIFDDLNLQYQEAFDRFKEEKERITFEKKKEAVRLIRRGVKISRVGELANTNALNWIYEAMREAGELTPLERKRLGLNNPRILGVLRDRERGIYRLDTADTGADEYAVLEWQPRGEFYKVTDSVLVAGSDLQRACRRLGAGLLPHPYNPDEAAEDFEKEIDSK